MSGTSRSGTRRSGAVSGVVYVLCEPEIGPVVTFGEARSVLKCVCSSARSSVRHAFGGKFPSLRRHDPDQVRRVTAPPFGPTKRPSVSQPPDEAPLGLRLMYADEAGCQRSHRLAGERNSQSQIAVKTSPAPIWARAAPLAPAASRRSNSRSHNSRQPDRHYRRRCDRRRRDI